MRITPYFTKWKENFKSAHKKAQKDKKHKKDFCRVRSDFFCDFSAFSWPNS